VSLPNADPGLILFGAEADPPAPLFEPTQFQRRAESFWDKLLQCALIAGVLATVLGLVVAGLKRWGGPAGPSVVELSPTEATASGGAVCSICGGKLGGTEIRARLVRVAREGLPGVKGTAAPNQSLHLAAGADRRFVHVCRSRPCGR
jgi:hypothetical protein